MLGCVGRKGAKAFKWLKTGAKSAVITSRHCSIKPAFKQLPRVIQYNHRTGNLKKPSEAPQNFKWYTSSTDHPETFLSAPELEILEDIHNKNIGDIAQDLCSLKLAAFKRIEHFPWLQNDSHIISYIQLALGNKINSTVGLVRLHPNFDQLLGKIEKNVPNFSASDLANITVSLTQLGIELQSSLFCKLSLANQNASSTDIDLPTLKDFAEVIRGKTYRDYKLIKNVINRFSDLLEHIEYTRTNARLVSQTAHTLEYYSSPRLRTKLYEITLMMFDKTDTLSYPEDIAAHMRMATRVSHGDRTIQKVMDILNACANAAILVGDRCNHGHLADICGSLKKAGYYDFNFAKAFKDIGYRKLNPDLKLNQIVNLHTVFKRDSPSHMKLEIESILLTKLKQEKIEDVILLSNICESLQDTNCSNVELLNEVQKHILHNVPVLTGHTSHRTDVIFKFVSNIIIRKNLLSKELKLAYHDHLWKAIDDPQTTAAGITKYPYTALQAILRFTDQPLPPGLFKKIIDFLPNADVKSLCAFAKRISDLQRVESIELKRQSIKILNAIYKAVLEQIHEVNDLGTLSNLVTSLCMDKKHRDPNLTNALMNLYPNFTKDLTDVSMYRVAKSIANLRFYLPEVMDDLVDTCIANQDTLTLIRLQSVIDALAQVGYTPRRSAEFSQIAFKLVNEANLNDNLPVNMVINFAFSMSLIQCYPHDILRKIFSLDYLKKADKTLDSAHLGHKQFMERRMMMLNRIVVLECPELDIPWFHEQYCKVNMLGNQTGHRLSYQAEHMKSEVARALNQILPSLQTSSSSQNHHGNQYTYGNQQTYSNQRNKSYQMGYTNNRSEKFTMNVFSPYYHHIDFSLLLDESNNPVNNVIDPSVPIPENWQKVAVLLYSEAMYCYSSSHLRGHQQSRKRHLEILGYNVVEISYLDWYSMANSEWSSKLTYLRNKLLDT
ncbi:unnamed protein product [Owenia fusiformis]|uniref:Uncharacterized protein n=1 Tax=Owenia fusiformis TaxID=6347 RepID=A0A8J1TTC7_OWEFU|nr:unnamed protein product [Owenia fusiformis]